MHVLLPLRGLPIYLLGYTPEYSVESSGVKYEQA